jgi:hypothetical protein
MEMTVTAIALLFAGAAHRVRRMSRAVYTSSQQQPRDIIAAVRPAVRSQ